MTKGVRSLAYPSAIQVEHRITVAASPDAIFRICADVEQWASWDPDTKQASLQVPFQVGSRGRLTPAKGSTVPMLLTEVVHRVIFQVSASLQMLGAGGLQRWVYWHVTGYSGRP